MNNFLDNKPPSKVDIMITNKKLKIKKDSLKLHTSINSNKEQYIC